jgi:hypothetical protein
MIENTFYSAMLNIAEPIPSNSRNSVYHFQHDFGIPGISSRNPNSYSDYCSLVTGIPGISSYQFLRILGISSDSGIEWSSCHSNSLFLAIVSNSRTEFRELSRTLASHWRYVEKEEKRGLAFLKKKEDFKWKKRKNTGTLFSDLQSTRKMHSEAKSCTIDFSVGLCLVTTQKTR